MILRGDYYSDILRSTANVQFMIPENYDNPENKEPYKVVYLLHGQHGNQGSWINNSMLPFYGKKYNAVFVMPEVGRSFYLNLKYGRSYYTYVSEELPKICRKIFNISARYEDTAVMGYSMGGYGSLMLSLSKPGVYSFCGAISPACLYFRPILDALRKDTSIYKKLGYEGEESLKDTYAVYGVDLESIPEYDIMTLVKNYPADKPKPKFYVTCGTEDSLLKENHKFRDEMKTTDFNYTYEEWSGNHDWDFFNEGLKKTLEIWNKG